MVTKTVITVPKGMENAGFHVEAREEDDMRMAYLVDEKTGFRNVLYAEGADEEPYEDFIAYAIQLAEEYGTQSGLTDEV